MRDPASPGTWLDPELIETVLSESKTKTKRGEASAAWKDEALQEIVGRKLQDPRREVNLITSPAAALVLA